MTILVDCTIAFCDWCFSMAFGGGHIYVLLEIET